VGAERRVRSVSVHTRGRSVDEQAARRRLTLALTTASVFASATAHAEPPKIADPDGTPVRITSTNVDTSIYLARGDAPRDPVDDPYERIGTAPLTIKLAPGVYTIQSSNPTSSLGHARFHVEQNHPLDIEVRNGDASVRTLGTVIQGLGIAAVLTGIAVVVSISPHDQSYHRWSIGLPLMIGGAGVFGVGLGLFIAGSTNVKMPTSAEQARTIGVFVRF
jgi:hypothetical protein